MGHYLQQQCNYVPAVQLNKNVVVCLIHIWSKIQITALFDVQNVMCVYNTDNTYKGKFILSFHAFNYPEWDWPKAWRPIQYQELNAGWIWEGSAQGSEETIEGSQTMSASNRCSQKR